MRLFDMLAADDPTLPSREEMPVIVADEIGAELDRMADGPDGDASFPAAYYGCVAPPFELFFVEVRTRFQGVDVYRGSAVRTATRDEFVDVQAGGVELDMVRWQYAITGYMWMQGWQGIRGYPGLAWLHLDQEGYLLDDMSGVTLVGIEDLPPGNYLPLPGLANHLVFTMLAVSAMHRRCEVEEVWPSRQQKRAARRRRGMELHSYYYLKVRPGGKRYVGSGLVSGRRKREHVVRGHFRYYTEERPLFGRVSGMVWIPEHQRGDSGLGSIGKGYIVEDE